MRLKMLGAHLEDVADYFSIGTLLVTMFSPWRQNVSVARSDQSFNDKVSAVIDNMVSRIVGAFVRFFMINVAIIWLAVVLVLNLVYVVVWPIIPLSPAILISIGATL